jgi:pyruvate dehydrogenase E2 component (dihydrolipoamide acetyltransferase)
MAEFRMPSLGADMEAGTIIEWRVRPGDTVHRGDIVAVVATDKSDIEVEVFDDGIVEELLVQPGREVPVGTVLARITTSTAAVAISPPATAPPPAAPPAAARPAAPATRPAGRRQPSRRPAHPARPPFVRASPLARSKAAAHGVDLATLAGSGPGGAVMAADVDGPTSPALRPPPPPKAEGKPSSGEARHALMGHATGTLMARSKREIPHYYLATTIDLGPALAWLAEANIRRSVAERLLPAALLLRATALAARNAPAMNGFWVDDAFQPAPAVHLGVAISLRRGGLVAPAIHDADGLSIDSLMVALRDLVQRTRAGVLRSSEMSDPTITVTNLGDQGIEEVFGDIYPPQVALVGFGKIVERPWAAGGMLGVRPVVRATLAPDHRASDGHDGAHFLTTIDRLLQTPEAL